MSGRRSPRAAAAALVGTVLALSSVLGLPAAAAAPEPTSPAAGTSYIPQGTPIDGGDSRDTGPRLTGPGQYLDTLPQGSSVVGQAGSDKFYTVDLPRGATPWFSVTMLFPDRRSNAAPGEVDLLVYDQNEDENCTFANHSEVDESGTATQPLSTAVVLPVVGGPAWQALHCPTNQPYVVEVFRSGNLFANDAATIELGYRIEPPATSSGAPVAPAPTGTQVPVTGNGAVHRMTAGYSFNNAPVLAPGRYRDSIVPGQTRYVRVALTWGQRFSFLLQSDPVPALGSVGLDVWTAVFNPVRGEAALSSDTSVFNGGFGTTDAPTVAGTTAVAVRYANGRLPLTDPRLMYSITGDYVLAITVGYADVDHPVAVPYTLVLSVSGHVERGATYHPERLGAAFRGSAADSPGSGSGLGTGPVIGIVAGAAVVIGLAGLIALLVRRRVRPAHAGAAPRPLPYRPPAQPPVPPGRPPAPGPGPMRGPGAMRGPGPMPPGRTPPGRNAPGPAQTPPGRTPPGPGPMPPGPMPPGGRARR